MCGTAFDALLYTLQLRSHSIVLRVVLKFSETKVLHERRNVHGESATEILLQAIPTANGIFFRASPMLDRTFFRFLLLVLTAQNHPVAVTL